MKANFVSSSTPIAAKSLIWENSARVENYDTNASFQQIWYRSLMDKVVGSGIMSGCVLDIGCSSGLFINEQARLYPDVKFTGLDYSSNMIELAQKNYVDQNNLQFFQGDAQQLESVAKLEPSYDLILAATVLHWVPDQEKALTSMYQKIRPGGQIVVRTFDDARGTPFSDPALTAIRALLPSDPGPFKALSMAQYMSFGEKLGVDRMRFEPESVDVPLPQNLKSAKNRILNWLNSWYEPPNNLDRDYHLNEVADKMLEQTSVRSSSIRTLTFHFVDMVITKNL